MLDDRKKLGCLGLAGMIVKETSILLLLRIVGAGVERHRGDFYLTSSLLWGQ
jgi:hypothetical protein